MVCLRDKVDWQEQINKKGNDVECAEVGSGPKGGGCVLLSPCPRRTHRTYLLWTSIEEVTCEVAAKCNAERLQP